MDKRDILVPVESPYFLYFLCLDTPSIHSNYTEPSSFFPCDDLIRVSSQPCTQHQHCFPTMHTTPTLLPNHAPNTNAASQPCTQHQHCFPTMHTTNTQPTGALPRAHDLASRQPRVAADHPGVRLLRRVLEEVRQRQCKTKKRFASER